MMRLAGRILFARFAIQKDIWPAHASADYKSVPARFGLTPLDQILLTVNVEAIAAAPGDLRYHVQAFTVLDRDPFCLPDIDGGISKMDGGNIPDPGVLGCVYAYEIPTVLLVSVIFFLFAAVVESYLRVEFGIAA